MGAQHAYIIDYVSFRYLLCFDMPLDQCMSHHILNVILHSMQPTQGKLNYSLLLANS